MSGIDQGMHLRKYCIVHGHFYQPPRENPWLDIIENQESAAPFHDWNERIYAQCYRPNGYSRLLDKNGMIAGINNNYDYMSFNFGPTLVSWLEKQHPKTLERIVDGDRNSIARCEGHGNALAQVYNHIILPLASRRDKLTQIRWAKASFKRSFRREAKGMWLAETAINMETVQCLVEEKILFVVLAPSQAEAFRPMTKNASWIDCSQCGIDMRRPYRVFATDASGVKTGGHIDVFFFDELLSKEISFNGLLQDAHLFGKRIDKCYSEKNTDDEVVVIATDGETFGHHKPFGDMCLAYFFRHVSPALGIVPVNFDYYRALHAPKYEVSLKNAFGEGSAWSCAHGVGRWARDCGCNTGGESSWNQAWRAPLRRALENLQGKIDHRYRETCRSYGIDPWELRDRYDDRYHSSPFKKWKDQLTKWYPAFRNDDEKASLLRQLLDAQRFVLYSFTSCGWFFSELSGIEPMQNLAFACRGLQLGLTGEALKSALEEFVDDLEKAPSNINNDNGALLFNRYILPGFYSDHAIAFACGIDSLSGAGAPSFKGQYGYIGTIEPHDECRDADAGDSVFFVTIDRPVYNQKKYFVIIVERTGYGETSGWALNSDRPKNPGNLSVAEIKRHPDVREVSLLSLFPTIREDMASAVIAKMEDRSIQRFLPWFDENEENLFWTKTLYPLTPDFSKTAARFVLQWQWDTMFCKSSRSFGDLAWMKAVVGVQEKIARCGVQIDLKVSAECCEKILESLLEEITKDPTVAKRDTFYRLMDVVDTYKLPIAKHRLEDIVYPFLIGSAHEIYQDVLAVKNKKIVARKQKRLEDMVKLARRMNFSTTMFDPSS